MIYVLIQINLEVIEYNVGQIQVIQLHYSECQKTNARLLTYGPSPYITYLVFTLKTFSYYPHCTSLYKLSNTICPYLYASP